MSVLTSLARLQSALHRRHDGAVGHSNLGTAQGPISRRNRSIARSAGPDQGEFHGFAGTNQQRLDLFTRYVTYNVSMMSIDARDLYLVVWVVRVQQWHCIAFGDCRSEHFR
jgi:hypothetical protein